MTAVAYSLQWQSPVTQEWLNVYQPTYYLSEVEGERDKRLKQRVSLPAEWTNYRIAIWEIMGTL